MGHLPWPVFSDDSIQPCTGTSKRNHGDHVHGAPTAGWGNVSLGGLGAGRIAYSLEGCGLQNLTCGLFSLKPRCDSSAVNF